MTEIATDYRLSPELELELEFQIRMPKDELDLQEPRVISIPLENRIAYLSLNGDIIKEWMPPSKIADLIGADARWVQRTAKLFGIEKMLDETVKQGERTYELYPPLTYELLHDEYQWHRSYLQLDRYIGCMEIAELVGRSIDWTTKTLKKLGVKKRTIRHGSRKLVGYPKTAAKTLRDINLSTPLDNGWITTLGLAELTGCDRGWIKARLREAGIEYEERRSSLSGRIFNYYPPDAVEVIVNANINRPKAAGNWLTAKAIADILPVSEDWVRRRLEENYQEVGEPRQDDQGVNRIHYPPTVLEELKEQVKKRVEFQPVGEYLPVSRLAKKVGHKVVWVTNRLEFINSEPEPRMDSGGHIIGCFPPDTVDELLSLPSDILKTR